MATKTRKRSHVLHGLGASAAEHKITAQSHHRVATKYFNDSIRLAESGKCDAALIRYGNGRSYDGAASTEAGHAKIDFGDESLDAMRTAVNTLRKHCLVGGGLSGMKRRRRK